MPTFPTITDTGYTTVMDMFDVAPDASGTTYYFDPDATGNDSGTSHANAFNTAAQVNAKSFSVGDQLLFLAGSTTLVTEKIRNTTMVGAYQNPFYVGAYHMDQGSEVLGRGVYDRPIIEGLPAASFDPYQNGSMNNATLMSMIPRPEANSGVFSQGSLEGIFNWYRDIAYDLYLWVEGIHVARSGGRAFRFSQSTGGAATGLLVQDVFCEGTCKHSLHVTGVHDAVMENVGHTQTSWEKHYWNPSSNRQAATAVKGSKNNYDQSSNVWFVQNYVYDGWSSEGLNTNSGNLDCSFVDNFVVDQGIYGIYIDRTRNSLVERNVIIRTSRTAFDDFTGIGSTSGRGVCGIMLQNESSTGSFPWNTYNTETDFNKYSVHDTIIRNNFIAGWSSSLGLHSQASAKAGEYHTGRDFGPYNYYYGNVSLHATEAHHMFDTFNQAPDYNITTTNPPRFWGNVYVNDVDTATDDPTDIGDLFDGNYFGYTPETDYNTGAVTSGYTMEDTDWDDLSYLMTTDADGHMTEANLLLFRDEVYSRLKPDTAPESGITMATYTDPAAFDMSDDTDLDFEGIAFSTTRNVGAYALDDAPFPVLSNPTASVITQYGCTPTCDTDQGDGTIYMTIGPDGESSWRIDIVAGVLRDQTPALAADNDTVTGTGTQTFAAVTGLMPATDYELQFVHDNAADGRSLKSFIGFTTAASATPVLSSPTALSVGEQTMTPRVTTDGDTGSIYMVVVPDGDAPSVTQIKNGQRSDGTAGIASGSEAVSASGTYTFPEIDILVEGTDYELYFVHSTSDDVDSLTSTVGFTTTSAPVDPDSDLTSEIASIKRRRARTRWRYMYRFNRK